MTSVLVMYRYQGNATVAPAISPIPRGESPVVLQYMLRSNGLIGSAVMTYANAVSDENYVVARFSS